MLSERYQHLFMEPGPRMLIKALELMGIKEFAGQANNPIISSWVSELDDILPSQWIIDYLQKDSTPWCGTFMAIAAQRAKKPVPEEFFRAKAWMNWGDAAPGEPELGDVLVFGRNGGGHVALYVGEDADCYHCLGGNQGDEVSITRIKKSRLLGARQFYAIAKPHNVRRIYREPNGSISTNEE